MRAVTATFHRIAQRVRARALVVTGLFLASGATCSDDSVRSDDPPADMRGGDFYWA